MLRLPYLDLDQRTDAVCVTITVPEVARESADMLFGPFLCGLSVVARGNEKLARP